MTSTKITIPKAGDASDGITVLGNKEGIEKALHEIKLISDEQSKQAFEKILVPKIYHPFVEGADRVNIKGMMEKYPGVRINIPPLSVNKDELSIAGEKEGVLAVKATITQIWKEMEKKCSSISVEVKKSQHRYVIGPKGNAINEILAETGVFVEMPPNDSTSETITLRGPQAKLGMALNKVYEKANSVVNESVHCPTWLHKYIIGRKGAGIQKISQDLQKVHIGFNDDDTIKVDGPPDDVKKATAELKSWIIELSKSIKDQSKGELDHSLRNWVLNIENNKLRREKAESDRKIKALEEKLLKERKNEKLLKIVEKNSKNVVGSGESGLSFLQDSFISDSSDSSDTNVSTLRRIPSSTLRGRAPERPWKRATLRTAEKATQTEEYEIEEKTVADLTAETRKLKCQIDSLEAELAACQQKLADTKTRLSDLQSNREKSRVGSSKEEVSESAERFIFEKKCKSQVFLNGALKISRTSFEDQFRFSARIARNQEYDEVSHFLSRKKSMVEFSFCNHFVHYMSYLDNVGASD